MESSNGDAPLDLVVERLQAIRDGAGLPSFGEIALGVSRVRRSRGLTPEMARVGRTTVYDAFRTGRRRLDAGLVTDIVLALGGGEELARDLAAECRAAQAGAPSAVLQAEPTPTVGAVGQPASMARRVVLVVLLGSVAVNLLGRVLVDLLGLPVYLDMIGTAFTAILLGPWWGALVGVSTNAVGVIPSGTDSLWFAPVNVVGALVWGYAARRWRMASSIPRFFLLNVVVAVVCTAVAVTTIVGKLGGFTGHGSDDITASVLELGRSLWVSVSVSNLLTSITDKLIAGFVSLALIETLPARMRAWAPTSWMRGESSPGIAVRACSELPGRV